MKLDIKNHLDVSLYKNSYYLMVTTLLTSGSGFFFWIFAARLYTVEEVGIGSALMSAAFLLSIFSLLGLDIALIRYLPSEKDKSGLINSCFTITMLAALLLAVIFLLGLRIWSPALMILWKDTVFGAAFVLFTIAETLFGLHSNVFVAFRQAKYALIKVIGSILRIVLLPFLVAFSSFGVYLSAGLATAIALLVGNMLIRKVLPSYKPIPVIKKTIVNDMLHYSLGNHISNIFYFLPVAVLPLLVVNVLGEEMNAYFWTAWSISAILLMIPLSASTSLFAESSFSSDRHKRNVIGSLKFIFILLIPAIVGIFIFGKYVLLLFGEMYAKNAFGILLILSIASIPHSLNVVYVAIKRVEQKITPAIYVYGAVMVFTLIGSFLLIPKMGLIGIGISWAFGNGIVAGIVGVKIIQHIR